MAKILVVGAINQDIIAWKDSAGDSVVKCFPGGKGFNQAVACHDMHPDTAFFGKIGNDIFSKQIIEYVQSISLKHRLDQTEKSTGVIYINLCPGREDNQCLTPGANHAFTDDDIAILDDYVTGDILVVQNEISVGFNLALIREAKNKGMRIVLNVAPYSNDLIDVLNLADYIIVNLTEFHGLAQSLNVTNAPSVAMMLQTFNSNIIVNLAEDGVIAKIDGEIFSEAALPIDDVIDSTGAGDCFCGVFASHIAKSNDAKSAVVLANKIAASSIQRIGAVNNSVLI